jgi:hypothetical protein
MIKEIRSYDMGTAQPIDRKHYSPEHSAIIEVELEDGRTVQLTVTTNGEVYFRGWGNIPARLGNIARFAFNCEIPVEEATHDDNYLPLNGD